MNIFFTSLKEKDQISIIKFLDKEIETIDSLLDLNKSSNIDKKKSDIF